MPDGEAMKKAEAIETNRGRLQRRDEPPLYAAAGRLPDAERRTPRGAFWGAILGT
jgi:hypothetical protein